MNLSQEFSSARNRGFSGQPDLLVMIAIVALLVGILLPALGKARISTNRSGLQSHFEKAAASFDYKDFRFCDNGVFYHYGRRFDVAAKKCQDWNFNLIESSTPDAVTLTDEKWKNEVTEAQEALQKALKRDDAPQWLNNNLAIVERFLLPTAPESPTPTPGTP